MMPAQAPLTLPRALTVAGLILGIAAAAHTAGGGRLPLGRRRPLQPRSTST